MEPTTPNSAATEHANDDNTVPRGSDATERAATHTHDEWRNRRLNCEWCGIEGQCLYHPTEPHLASLTDVDPYGWLCDRCFDAARPPRFSYVDMVLRQILGTVPEVCDLVAEYAYRSCVDCLEWQKHNTCTVMTLSRDNLFRALRATATEHGSCSEKALLQSMLHSSTPI